jgi:hypothetical protein
VPGPLFFYFTEENEGVNLRLKAVSIVAEGIALGTSPPIVIALKGQRKMICIDSVIGR